MILVAYQRTMANAKRIVPDTGFPARQLKARQPEAVRVVQPRPRLVATSRRICPHTPLQRIVELVARMHGVPYDAVMSPSRTRNVCQARFAAICAVHEAYPDMTLYRIGQRFGRDHSTVLHAFKSRGVVYVPFWSLDRSPQPGDGTAT